MKKSSVTAGFKLSTQTIVLAAVAWAIIALLFFLLFSVPLPNQGRPDWYNVMTYVLENTAYLVAGILCFRNWRSPQIVSGRTVWLLIGLGLLSYFVGNLFLGYWEIGLGKEPDVSPGDFFFLATYLFLGSGMFMAVTSRQLTLSVPQYAVIGAILAVSASLAYFLVLKPSQLEAMLPSMPQNRAAMVEFWMPPANATTPPVADPAPMIAPAPDAAVPVTAPTSAEPPVAAEPPEKPVPGWATTIEELLAPLASIVLLLYVVGDVILVVMATTLLLAFWGGRFSLSWRFIAAAAFSLYIADLWFLYAVYNIADYNTGALPEVFFIFSPCLFAIGAALEYDLSTRSRRGSSRRRAA